jgi:hypothetical protein
MPLLDVRDRLCEAKTAQQTGFCSRTKRRCQLGRWERYNNDMVRLTEEREDDVRKSQKMDSQDRLTKQGK